MIYGFTRQSGGQAHIYSEVGKGTMVCLYLPRHHGAIPASNEMEAVLAPMPVENPKETVLVVDDDPAVRLVVAEVLTDLGYAFIEAADGAAALEVLRSESSRIDLLITDVGLPNNPNGRQLADAGRTIRPDLKVLFITGYAEKAVVHHGHLGHNMNIMMKPFALDALRRRVTEIIASPR
jgi:CheY-like chemotaxis protein